MGRTTAMRKATFCLPAHLLRQLREVVAAGLFPSQNALVREALENELKRAAAERLRREFQEAANDTLFLRDVKETDKAFRSADSETARMTPDG